MRTVAYRDGAVRLIDQTLLPERLDSLDCRAVEEVADAIRAMRVRGAPAIGVTAAFGLALAGDHSDARDPAAWLAELERAAALLRATRPTAVNLAWALERCLEVARRASADGVVVARDALRSCAQRLADEDVETNRRMGALGAALLPAAARVLTHCNTGALATVDFGTALGVVRAARDAGKQVHVYVDETRPFLQGARLTAWELEQERIPYTLITDSMAGHFLARGDVDLVLVGADRIAANGDVANKVGTYPLAVLCKENGLPFYVVAPTSTIDLTVPDGGAIPIEERSPEEVTHVAGRRIAPRGARAAHPAFDVTPARYVSAIVTERGIARSPYRPALAGLAGATLPAAAGT